MKDAVLKLLESEQATLNRLRFIAETLPEEGPTPWHVSTLAPGEIHYSGPHQIKPVIEAFGGIKDWCKERTARSLSITYFKKLANGVTVYIDNAEAAPELNEPVVLPEEKNT